MRRNLINARKNSNYTQKQIAQEIKISENQYQRLELGKSDGSVKVWEHLRDILHAPNIDYLLEQEVKYPPK